MLCILVESGIAESVGLVGVGTLAPQIGGRWEIGPQNRWQERIWLVCRGVSVSRSHMSFYLRTGGGDDTCVVLL